MAAATEVHGGDPPAVAERLRALLSRRTTGPEAAQLAVFARLLLRRGGGYLDELPDDEVAAMVASAFRFYAAPGPELRVRVLTPSYGDEGWDAPVSIIETSGVPVSAASNSVWPGKSWPPACSASLLSGAATSASIRPSTASRVAARTYS